MSIDFTKNIINVLVVCFFLNYSLPVLGAAPINSIPIETYNRPINQVLDSQTVAWYSMKLWMGQGISVELTKHLNAGNLSVYLTDSEGNTLQEAIGNDPSLVIEHTASTKGTYYLKVEGSPSAFGNYDLAVYKAWFNAEASKSNRNYYATHSTASYLKNGHFLLTPGKARWMRFSATAGSLLRFNLTGHLNSGRLNAYLTDSAGNILKQASDTQTVAIEHTAALTGVYYFKVEGDSFDSGDFDLIASGYDVNVDSDGDGLFDVAEYFHGTDAAKQDTDNDGMNDSDELLQGRDPRTNQSYRYTLKQLNDAATPATALPLPVYDQASNQRLTHKSPTWYSMNLLAGQGISIALKAHLDSGRLNAYLTDGAGNKLKQVLGVENEKTAQLEYSAPSSGVYFLKMESASASGNYDIAVYNAWFNTGFSESARSYHATRFTADYLKNGRFSVPLAETQWLRFFAQSGSALNFKLTGHLNSGRLNAYLMNGEANKLQEVSGIADGQTVTIQLSAQPVGFYYLKLEASAAASGSFDLTASGYEADGNGMSGFGFSSSLVSNKPQIARSHPQQRTATAAAIAQAASSIGVQQIAVGGAHTCALTGAGGVKCWGYNEYGQLGDNSTTSRLTPTEVAGLSSGVTAISG